jgi:hypothetical protein
MGQCYSDDVSSETLLARLKRILEIIKRETPPSRQFEPPIQGGIPVSERDRLNNLFWENLNRFNNMPGSWIALGPMMTPDPVRDADRIKADLDTAQALTAAAQLAVMATAMAGAQTTARGAPATPAGRPARAQTRARSTPTVPAGAQGSAAPTATIIGNPAAATKAGSPAVTTKAGSPAAATEVSSVTVRAELEAARQYYRGHRGEVGTFLVEGRQPVRVKSGVEGGSWGGTQRGHVPRGQGYGFTSGGPSQGNIGTHVEGHTAAIMHEQGIKKGTLIMGAEQCSVCGRDLPSALPPESELTVIVFDEKTGAISSTIYRSSHAP